MRRLAKVLLSAGGVLVLTAAGLAWLVATPSGQQMLLRTALPLVPGLKAGSIEGGSDAESSTPCGCRISSFVTAMRRSERSASRSSLSVMRSAPAVRPGIS